jgi:small subunit ribosomal protein S4
MARYIGPVCRQCRHIGEKLMLKGERCSSPKCPLEKRSARPKERSRTRRRRESDRALQLKQKQKVRFSYGVLERQFRRFFAAARKAPGVTGENMLVLLERRLDNVVYCVGFASSRAQARQVVRHGHIRVNGRKVDIPSYLVRAGDVVSWREESVRTVHYKRLAEEIKGRAVPGWLSLNEQRMTGSVMALPGKDDIDPRFDGKAIVEYYSR